MLACQVIKGRKSGVRLASGLKISELLWILQEIRLHVIISTARVFRIYF